MKISAILLALAFATHALAARAEDNNADQVARGAYLARIMDCAGCHMPRGQDGAPILEAGLSGGNIGFELPGFGTFWPPNLTPASTALGSWSKEQIVAAIRQGVRPDGRMLVPVMPWQNYAALTDEDAYALATYLRSLEPVESPVRHAVAPGEKATAPFFRLTLP